MKLIELQGSVDQNGELAIPRTLLVDMGLRPGDSVRLTYASGSGAMDNTHRQFVVTPDGIAAAMLKPREDSCGCGLTLPHELLEASDFPRDCDLEVVCAPGAIVILSADILDRLPDDLRALFADLGIDPDTVREVMKEGGFPL
jgi:antitoxin component of MazEF toxin-antitoxin module